MISNSNENMISIVVNGHKREVYKNQTVLQSTLQINEKIQHDCLETNYVLLNKKYRDCTIELCNFQNNRKFQACLAPVKEGMIIIETPNKN